MAGRKSTGALTERKGETPYRLWCKHGGGSGFGDKNRGVEVRATQYNHPTKPTNLLLGG